jgi:uncharacterized protein (DUF1810 family)
MDLERFVEAQDADGTYHRALAEVRRGRKLTHWMWFVFPQLRVLGRSPTARHYGIADLDEARAYLAHPVLGLRLRECAAAAADIRAGEIERAFGSIDTIKLRSSMTLFEAVDPDEPSFRVVLDKHFGGQRDPLTLQHLDAP